ncbi:alpha/beta hydrolase [Paenibacillus sp. GCM10012307]|uniref:Esterase family protein n=1 Tax=Paenibacillus roseus TaxID=2798579 RepID=A0A934MNT5_9BACL|nr:alpha/beta hydrolase family protein [Paenibacillus roseus]MBJ6360158.1 esterase family protein [Paenibacillus roseus]
MALIQCNYFAETLGLSVTMNVILPVPGYNQAKQSGKLGDKSKFPTLYLLHGLSDDHTIWQRATSIERDVSGMNLAVIMPTVYRGFYTDMKHGHNYWTFISEELPHIAESLFPLSDRREERFAAGLSMGGYGAFKLGLRHPERFAAVASLSGAMDILTLADEGRPLGQTEYNLIFGSQDEAKGSDNDLFELASRLKRSDAPVPKLFQCCGTEDFLYADNQRFLAHVQNIGLEVTYEEEAGKHDWRYWDAKIKRVLEWLPLT